MKEPWHGTVGGYTNHGCRCTECRQAAAVYRAEHYMNTRPAERKRPGRRPWAPDPNSDVAWMADRNCEGVDPNVFVPSVGYGWTPDEAFAVCRGCQVRAACLRYGRATRSEGVFGGVLLGLRGTGDPREERQAS